MPNEQPENILFSDFRFFVVLDLELGDTTWFSIDQLPDNIDKSRFIIGQKARKVRGRALADFEACEIMGRIYGSLKESGCEEPELDLLIVRLLFCLFADDTGIFEPRHYFHDLLAHETKGDGTDLGVYLTHMFEVLNTPVDERMDILRKDLARLPFLNSKLFQDRMPIPGFNAKGRNLLLVAGGFDWANISPAIFGALFQSVMDTAQRRKAGVHYTTEDNILKVVSPLFLDELKVELSRIRGTKSGKRRQRLVDLQKKLAGLKFLDPACGCGNFLIIAYRELRRLEIEIIKELHPRDNKPRQLDMYPEDLSLVDVDQFYGMEISAFPVRIAETAMWMMDHFMNIELSDEFGKPYLRIPLEASPRILHCDALETDWNDLLPAEECSYVIGNPPFAGSKQRSPGMSAQVNKTAGKYGAAGILDYVAPWFILAGEYIKDSEAKIGFVATSSIVQGEQAAQLWPILFNRLGLEITFAHRPFLWDSDAKGKASVNVVVIGLDMHGRAPKNKSLYAYEPGHDEPLENNLTKITPYLLEGDGLADHHLTVKSEPNPINGLPKLKIGTKLIDDGNYILDEKEKRELLKQCPEAKQQVRPFLNAWDFLNAGRRWVLCLHDAPPGLLKASPIMRRIQAVRRFRSKSTARTTRELSPDKFHVNVIPTAPFIAIPSTTSENRGFIPMDWISPPTVPSDALLVLEDASLWLFALLNSSMHMAWMRQIGGRLTSSYRYSIGIVYNTFPVPQLTKSRKATLEKCARQILDVRKKHPGRSLADLYNMTLMPDDLRKAHRALDRAVDKIYRKTKFNSESERLVHLLKMYEKMISPVTRQKKPRKKAAN